MRFVALDLGQRRIGVAVSDPSGTLARPLATLERGRSDAAAAELVCTAIAKLHDEDAIGTVVVGLPVRLDGFPSLQTPKVQKMMALLSVRLPMPVIAQDERLSSHEADQRLMTTEKDWRKRKVRLDAAAAAVILQDFLDARSERNGRSDEEDLE